MIVGLGNPGRRYDHSRHNIGVRVAERFASDCGFSLSESRYLGRFGRGVLRAAGIAPDSEAASETTVAVLAPETFMNRSGQAVAQALDELEVEPLAADLIVVFDDLDLPFGRLRIRPQGSSGGHRGLASVIEFVGSGDFPRLRFGIGRSREPDDAAVDWVLQDFSVVEESALPHHIARASDALFAMILSGLNPAMNRYNRDPDAEQKPEV